MASTLKRASLLARWPLRLRHACRSISPYRVPRAWFTMAELVGRWSFEVLDSCGTIACLGSLRDSGTGDRVVVVVVEVASVLLLPIGLPFRGGCVQKRGGVFSCLVGANLSCICYIYSAFLGYGILRVRRTRRYFAVMHGYIRKNGEECPF